MPFIEKEKYNIDDLVEIVHILRSPGGCPWDMEQTHSSIRQDLLEEAYEVADAIDSGSVEALREELGDLLLQVVFHAGIEHDKGAFTFDDVCDEVCRKMIIRHPHVFADLSVSGTQEVLANWDVIKQDTKGQKTVSDTLESVPRCFPALMRAAKLAKKVPGSLESPLNAQELFASFSAQDKPDFGRLLFSAAYLVKSCGVDPELALSEYCDAFVADYREAQEAGETPTVAHIVLDE